MNQKTLKITLILSLLIGFSLVGCAPAAGPAELDAPEISPVENESQGERQPIVGMANPASVYCQGLGFKEERRENEKGQYGVCVFPDNTECDTWAFLSGKCGQEFSYCTQQGFDLDANDQSNISTCVFNDGSVCDEFSYFKGDCKPGEMFRE